MTVRGPCRVHYDAHELVLCCEKESRRKRKVMCLRLRGMCLNANK